MLLETLGRLRAKASLGSTGGDSGYQAGRESVRSSNTVPSSVSSSVTSSPSGSSKRYSNNLFSSGKLRDYKYLRGSQQHPRNGSNRSTLSTLSSSSSRLKSSEHVDTDHSLDPPGSSAQSDHTQTMSLPVSLPNAVSSSECKPSTAFSRDHMRRASIALEEVIREIEEEAEADKDGDDEILIPRSPVSHSDAYDRLVGTSKDMVSL